MTKSKKLACAACDVLIELSRGTLKRAITKADEGTNDVCVDPRRIKSLFETLEAAHPGLYERAKLLLEKQDEAAKPARDAQHIRGVESMKCSACNNEANPRSQFCDACEAFLEDEFQRREQQMILDDIREREENAYEAARARGETAGL